MGGGELEGLARQAAAGDSAALSRLVEEVQHPVYRLALRFLGHPEDAKDATREILVRLITHLGQFEGRSRFMTWAYTIAVRQLMRTRKRQLEELTAPRSAWADAEGRDVGCVARLACI
jgi:RNA polymerase sigma factor (sigma-70 family)